VLSHSNILPKGPGTSVPKFLAPHVKYKQWERFGDGASKAPRTRRRRHREVEAESVERGKDGHGVDWWQSFLPRDPMRKRGLRCWPVSVGLSVTIVCCIQTAEDIIKLLPRHDSPNIL